ncbi:Ig-like domain-containing protein [Salegentibacter salegens]|uniref:Por secretion system C-terminal sorting domain-containing protein n=1 Tax=Salegentibacter salegens TaxID=143223 RepID=A0A1M7KGL5_9FLAO|nr:Ig-like domain-containing protein [Salegentibacter salegens]PRX49648.1 putative secreted protein (Por secretion system target) [Salegentibacter salegens]SHM64448.1 Por secretion system C-terminal sorting domain-containing protein [Salegentibacter salegens]
MKQSYFTSPGFTFRLQPFGTPTALFLLFFLLNFSFGFGQGVTISSDGDEGPVFTQQQTIPLTFEFEEPINGFEEGDINVNGGSIINFDAKAPSYNWEDSLEIANNIGYTNYGNLILATDYNSKNEMFALTLEDGVRKFEANGDLANQFFIPFDQDYNGKRIERPFDLSIDSRDYIYIADSENCRILIFDENGNLDDIIGGNCSNNPEKYEFSRPFGLAIDDDDRLYIADSDASRIHVYSFERDYTYFDKVETPIRLDVDNEGNIYVSDRGGNNGRIIIFNSAFNQIGTIDNQDGLGSPGSVIVDDNNIYISDLGNVNLTEIFEAGDNPLVLLNLLTGLANAEYSVKVFDKQNSIVDTIKDQIDIPIDLAFRKCDFLAVNNGEVDLDNLQMKFDLEFYNLLPHSFTANLEIDEQCVSAEVSVAGNVGKDANCDPTPNTGTTFTATWDQTKPVRDNCVEDDITVPSGFMVPDYIDNGEVSFDDNCGVENLIYTQTPEDGETITQNTTVTITATDKAGNVSDVCSFDLVVETPNTPPVAVDDTYDVDQDAILNKPAPGVLENDTDDEDDVLTVQIVTPPANGTVSLDPDGSFTYEPDAGYFGTDTFTYIANDGEEDSSPATVTITVNEVVPPNTAPQAVNDQYEIDQDETLTRAAPGVLSNDTDAEGDALTAEIVDQPENGTVTLDPDGSFTYEPDAGYFGTDTFTYTANDGQEDSSPATVTITVNEVVPPNTAPQTVDDDYEVDQDETLTISAPGVLENDIDDQNDDLTVQIVTPPANGTVSLDPDGSFTYEPDAGYFGTDTFTYIANDGNLYSDEATVTININEFIPANRPPNALAESYTINQGEVLNIAAPGVLENDSDPDGDNLTADLRRPAANGDFSFASNGSFTYEPDPGFTGVDDFIYVAYDGEDFSGEVRVTITVNQVNSAPIAEDDTYEVDQDEILNIPAPGVLGNDEDEDGDNLTANLEDGAQNGTLTLNSDGSFEYEPDDGFSGQDSFTYSANDGELDSNIATVTITVNSTDPAAPDIECLNHEIFLDENGQATLDPRDIFGGELGNLELSADTEDFDCSNLGENTVILTATDPNTGLSSSCPTEVLVLDDIAPEANCVAPGRTFQLQDGSVTISPSAIDLNSSDNCEITRTLSEDTFTTPGTKNIILYVEDAAGNTDECSTTIEILPEDTDRVYRCIEEEDIPNIRLDEDCELNIPDYTRLIETENFNPAITQTYEELTEDTYLITVEIRDADTDEFVGDCEFSVNIVDLIPPTISCPDDQIESFDPNTGFQVPNYENMAGISDNCDEVIFRQEPAAGEIIYNNTTVNLFVEDEGGLEASCSFELELTEADVLNISCQIDKNVNPDANCSFWLPDYSDTAEVNFSAADITQTPPAGTIITENTQIKLTASLDGETDDCYFMVNLVDSEDPVANCVSGYVVNLGNDGTATINPEDLDNNSTDNCGIVSMALSQVDFTTADIGVVPVTLTVRDDAGNIDSCETTVEVVSEASGTFECRENIEVFLDENGEAGLNLQDLYTGDSSGLNFVASQLNFTCEDLGAGIIQLEYSGDETGSCMINVEVRDKLPPEINTNLVELTLNPEGFAYLEEADILAEDNCSEELIYRFSKSVFTCKDVGVNSVNVEVEDVNGNRSNQNIQVRISGESCEFSEIGEYEFLFLYPNPNNGIFTIATPEGVFIEQVRVFDSRGRYLMQQDYNANARFYRMIIQGVEESVYTLQIFTNEGVTVKRAIIKR